MIAGSVLLLILSGQADVPYPMDRFIPLSRFRLMPVVGDFDQDGVGDFIGSGASQRMYFGGRLPILQVSAPLTAAPVSLQLVRVADLTGDGYPDLLAVRFDNTVPGGFVFEVWANTGKSSGVPAFARVANSEIGCSPAFIGDINRDGLNDILCEAPSERARLGAGGGRFTLAPNPSGAGMQYARSWVADLNGDGSPDRIMFDGQIWWGNPDFSFRRGPEISFGNRVADPIFADYDGNGTTDIIVPGWSGLPVGTPGFPAGTPGNPARVYDRCTDAGCRIRPLPFVFEIGWMSDVNHDGLLDFASGGVGDFRLHLSGTDGYRTLMTGMTRRMVSGVTLADFDGDTRPDMIFESDENEPQPQSRWSPNRLPIYGIRVGAKATAPFTDAVSVPVELIGPPGLVTPRGRFEMLGADGRVLAQTGIEPIAEVNLITANPAAIVGRGFLRPPLSRGIHPVRIRYVNDSAIPATYAAPVEIVVVAPVVPEPPPRAATSFRRVDDNLPVEDQPFALEVEAPAASGRVPSGELVLERAGQRLSVATLRNGRASLQAPPQPGGLLRLTLVYAGDANFAPVRQDLDVRVARTWRVSSAANSAVGLAPDSLATGFGVALASATASGATAGQQGGVSLSIRDNAGRQHTANLLFVSPGQVNFHVPAAASTGPAVATLTRSGGDLIIATFTLQAAAPGIFTAPPGLAPAALVLRQRADGVRESDLAFVCDATGVCQPKSIAVREGEVVVVSLFGTGLPGVTAENLRVVAGRLTLPVTFVGPQAETPGLYQINVSIPVSAAGMGLTPLFVIVDGVWANTVNLQLD